MDLGTKGGGLQRTNQDYAFPFGYSLGLGALSAKGSSREQVRVGGLAVCATVDVQGPGSAMVECMTAARLFHHYSDAHHMD